MARKVFVSSDMSVDESLMEISEHSPLAPLLWPWLLTAFDDWGRAEASPLRLKAKVFPMFAAVTVQVITEALTCFSDHGLVETYTVAGKDYIAVLANKWFKYQTHIHGSKRSRDESKLPAPPSWSAYQSALKDAEPRADEHQQTEQSREIAGNREVAREIAGNHTPARVSSPSLSPSLSPSPSKEEDALLRNKAAAVPPTGGGKVVEKPSDKPKAPNKERQETLGQEACDAYQTRYKSKYDNYSTLMPTMAVQLKNLRVNLGSEKFYRALENFFACDNPVVVRRRHAVAMLFGEINIWENSAAVEQSYPKAGLGLSRAAPSPSLSPEDRRDRTKGWITQEAV